MRRERAGRAFEAQWDVGRARMSPIVPVAVRIARSDAVAEDDGRAGAGRSRATLARPETSTSRAASYRA
jgi:hypothetical protein